MAAPHSWPHPAYLVPRARIAGWSSTYPTGRPSPLDNRPHSSKRTKNNTKTVKQNPCSRLEFRQDSAYRGGFVLRSKREPRGPTVYIGTPLQNNQNSVVPKSGRQSGG